MDGGALRVAVYPMDRAGCGSYRLIWPAEAVGAIHGGPTLEVSVDPAAPPINVIWTEHWPDAANGTPPPEHVDPVDVIPTPACDVAVFQRPMHREMALTFPILRAKGVAVVVDMDDNFDAIDRDNIAWYASEPCWHTEAEARRIATLHGGRVLATKHTNHGWYLLPDHPGRTHRGWIRDALAHVDLLTVSTPALAEHYSPFVKSGRVKVIRNHLPARYCDIVRPPNPRPVVGWTGTIQTHPKDLDVVGDGVARAKAETDFDLRIVGTGVGCRARWGVDPDVATGWRPIEQYPTEYAQMDVALCPLNESEFNRAKSNLKALEAAALGVVPIMSPSEEYLRFHKRHGIGLIARTPDDWRRHIVRLVTDHELRARMAAHGRQVARSLTIEGNAQLWVDAWRSAVLTNARFRRVAA